MIEWTPRNALSAYRQGWRINRWGFIRPLYGSSAIFEHDSALYNNLLARAKEGDKLCIKAIAFTAFYRLTNNDFKI